MSQYKISNDFLEIITGTNNTTSRVYQEAVKDVDDTTPKAMGYLKNFITSIENIASKENVKDERITASKGNITSFSGYDNIKTAMSFLDKNLGKIEIMKDLNTIFNTLNSLQSQYTDGYSKNIRLIVLEYESALYLLVTGLSMAMSNSIDMVQNGTQIKIQKKEKSEGGIIISTIGDLSKQISSPKHKEYLEELIKNKDKMGVDTKIEESVTFLEGTIADTIDLTDAIINNVSKIASTGKRLITNVKNSIFGIVPLIRSVLYMRYKKKADTILALDQQVQFINMNIEQLQNKKNVDPAKKAEIIKKQQAMVEMYNKKAAKLRAELSEGEKAATTSLKNEDPEIKKVDDGDFVLEGGINIDNIFEESVSWVTDDIKKKS